MKTIVTHISPDLDALTAIWLIRRFFPGWEKAKLEFVPAGQTFQGKPVDNDPDVIHVDTGLGKYDHHQTKEDICAAALVLEEILAIDSVSETKEKIKDWQKEALKRILKIVNEDDHAGFLDWPEPASDRWEFNLNQIADGLVNSFKKQAEFVEYFLPLLDSLLKIMTGKIEAEEIIKNGREFATPWGKGIAAETENAEFRQLALKLGYVLVVKKRPQTGHLGIYANWQKGVNLKKIYRALIKADPDADWYFHISGFMVLNGSTSNPGMKPTKLKLEEVVKLIGLNFK